MEVLQIATHNDLIDQRVLSFRLSGSNLYLTKISGSEIVNSEYMISDIALRK